jgi:hypothetical protein
VGRTIEKYLRNDSEQKRESQSQTETHLDSESPSNLQEVGDLEANRLAETGPATIEKAPEIDLTEPAEPLVEISQEAIPVIDKVAELYELPVKDLELLLVELDANPLEVQPERNIEAEPGREQ